MREPGRRADGCLKALGFLFGLAVLAGIGSCALLNSEQIAVGFPKGLHYDRVLAYRNQSGLMEGCGFVAYHLTDRRVTLSNVEMIGLDKRISYSPYKSTPVAMDGVKLLIDGQARHIPALGAAGGCDNQGVDEVVGPYTLLSEPGNYFSIGSGGEEISIISPHRRLVLFLYFG